MRKFNITGSIIPEEHYYVDRRPQIEKLTALVEEKTYFVINRPRQFGKTTLLNFLARSLQAAGKHAPALISFQSLAQRVDINEAEFYAEVAKLIHEELNFAHAISIPTPNEIGRRSEFFDWLREICQNRKLVLLIDEIDAVPETVVIGFLANLREMYLQRSRRPSSPAPHAVALAGVHDIKNLKARYRDETQTIGSGSPFNIAIDYALPPFSLENIRQYYLQHTQETGQEFDERVFARVHHVTSGHPWLVSVLAKTLVEELAPERRQRITIEHTEAAIQKLIASRNTNFESLFNNAKKPNLFPIVRNLLIGRRYRFNIQDDDIDLGVRYGIFAEKDRQLSLANLIYAQALYQHFERELKKTVVEELVEGHEFQDEAGRLDFRRVMKKFQAFMKAKGAALVKHPSFKEVTAQLLFLSYLDLLVNGKGWTFKEVESGEGRIDVMCCYGQQKEIVELKLWYGERKYEEGLEQLAKYLESESLDHGWFIVFDRRKSKRRRYAASRHKVAGKKIQAWVV
jgi:energy-coupling factor transporter ATP-binding protein EcfA2